MGAHPLCRYYKIFPVLAHFLYVVASTLLEHLFLCCIFVARMKRLTHSARQASNARSVSSSLTLRYDVNKAMWIIETGTCTRRRRRRRRRDANGAMTRWFRCATMFYRDENMHEWGSDGNNHTGTRQRWEGPHLGSIRRGAELEFIFGSRWR